MAMGKTENNEQTDADILECKADILRARDIIPGGKSPNKQKAGQEPNPQINCEAITSADDAAGTSLKGDKQEKTQIPRFDLAEDIMAAHRRVISIRRKAPDKKIEAQELKPEPISYNIKQPEQELSEQERIIAEIVAKDIEILYRGGPLSVR
jgi:hypothetical protein